MCCLNILRIIFIIRKSEAFISTENLEIKYVWGFQLENTNKITKYEESTVGI